MFYTASHVKLEVSQFLNIAKENGTNCRCALVWCTASTRCFLLHNVERKSHSNYVRSDNQLRGYVIKLKGKRQCDVICSFFFNKTANRKILVYFLLLYVIAELP